MGGSEILRQYLFQLGFKVDQTEQGKIDKTLVGLDKKALALAKGLAGVAAAAQTMVAVFAFQMEKLYYSSRKAESSAENLQAYEFAAQRAGLANGKLTATVEGLARSMRANPGLQALLEGQFGIQVEGRDKVEVLRDLVEQLSGMPHYLAQQYGSLFGIDPDDLLLLRESLDALDQAAAKRKAMGRDAGLDMEAAARAGKEYANQLREISEMFGVLKNQLAVELLPLFKEMSGTLINALNAFSQLIKDVKDRGLVKQVTGVATEWWGDMKRLVGPTQGGGTHAAMGLWDRFRAGLGFTGDRVTLTPDAKNRSSAPETRFSALEEKYGLPAGLLDKMWLKESGRGKNMKSQAGAEGHFQFMPRTAREYGLDDPYDLAKSADAAARKMQNLLRYYHGDLGLATGAYNAGEGVMDAYLAGKRKLKPETLDYMRTVGGATVEQTNNYTINGSNAADIGRAVGQQQERTNGDLVRNFRGAVQ